MSSLVITVKMEPDQVDLQDRLMLDSNKGDEQALLLADLFKRFASGQASASFDVQSSDDDPVAASGTLTLASAAAGHTAVIGGVTFTGSSSPSGAVQFEIDGDDTADAAALVAKINAHSTLSDVVVASSALGVVTVTCKQKGVFGNFIALAGTGNISASGAALEDGAGGSDDTASSYEVGLS